MPLPILTTIGSMLLRGASAAMTAGRVAGTYAGTAARGAGAAAARAFPAGSRAAQSIGQGIVRGSQTVINNVKNVVNLATGSGWAKPSQMPGLTASELMGMAGKTPAEIASAQHDRRVQQAAEANAQKMKDLAESFSLLSFTARSLIIGPGSLSAVSYACAAFSRSVLSSREKFAEYNGTIASAFLQLRAAEFRSNVRVAGATSGSTEVLAESVMRMNESLEPIKIATINGVNFIATVASEMATMSAEWLKFIAMWTPIVGPLYEALSKYQKTSTLPLDRLLEQIGGRGPGAWQPAPPMPPPMQPVGNPPGRNVP